MGWFQKGFKLKAEGLFCACWWTKNQHHFWFEEGSLGTFPRKERTPAQWAGCVGSSVIDWPVLQTSTAPKILIVIWKRPGRTMITLWPQAGHSGKLFPKEFGRIEGSGWLRKFWAQWGIIPTPLPLVGQSYWASSPDGTAPKLRCFNLGGGAPVCRYIMNRGRISFPTPDPLTAVYPQFHTPHTGELYRLAGSAAWKVPWW